MDDYYSYKETKIPVRAAKQRRTRDTSLARQEQSHTKSMKSGQIVRGAFVALIALAVMLGGSGLTILASAFEAHVVNVTAKIEPAPGQCDALSIGYWRNHEGCAKGDGASIWTPGVNTLSASFSGAFSAYNGVNICSNLWVPNCPKGNTVEAKLCKASAQTLADELNVVSGRLDLRALLAGADDESSAFDNLGLSPLSSVEDAFVEIERILTSLSPTIPQLTDAAYVAERMYSFYEDENPSFPMCIYEIEEGAVFEGAVQGAKTDTVPEPSVDVEDEEEVTEEESDDEEEGEDSEEETTPLDEEPLTEEPASLQEESLSDDGENQEEEAEEEEEEEQPAEEPVEDSPASPDEEPLVEEPAAPEEEGPPAGGGGE